jgi:hypothetical protein
MRLRGFCLLVLPLLIVPLLAVSARADILGVAGTYAVLATNQVTNPGTNKANTVITGNMGDTSCTGFVTLTGCTLGFGTVSGTVNLGNAALDDGAGSFQRCVHCPSYFPAQKSDLRFFPRGH